MRPIRVKTLTIVAGTFAVLSDDEFLRLTPAEKLAYLKLGISAMERLMRQIRIGMDGRES